LPGSATTSITSSRVAPTATVARPTSPGSATAGFFSSVSTPGPVAKPFFGKTINAPDLHAASLSGKFQLIDLFDNLVAIQPPPPSVLALRTRAAIFGHNAPKWGTLPIIQRIGEYGPDPGSTAANPPYVFIAGPYHDRMTSWAEQTLADYPHDPALPQEPAHSIYLDNVYSSIVEDSWIVLKSGDQSRAYQVERTAEISKSDFTLSAKITRLTLNSNSEFSLFGIRETTVFAQSEALTLARLPIEKAVSGKVIDLNSWVDGLFQGQSIMVCGELDNERGVRTCEVATIDNIDQVVGIDGFTRITLRDALDHAYVRDTVMIHANVALATHGESTREVLGSGDAGQSFQRFTLRQPPLTYVSASTPSGAQTTLKVRVNGLLWHEVPTFFGHGPDERIYVTHTDNDGNTTVMFGDGKTGARLPTGQENVTVTYRKGIGLAGLVKANQLTQLMTRPLGVKEVTNPMAPNGAADRENLSEARRNAPLTVLTLDRIVSLQDYEDFARAFAGIDKALATWTWRGQTRGVFVTVAGSNGAEVPSDSTLYDNLLEAMQQVRDTTVPLEVASYEPRLFQLSAAVKVHPDYLSEQVFAMIEQRLREHFSFEARSFGQPVHFSEVVAIMQQVPGVQAVTIKTLYRTDTDADQEAGLTAPLESSRPHPGVDTGFAAELLTLDPRPIELEVLT
jgi:predicted phage baseplate assembly protein